MNWAVGWVWVFDNISPKRSVLKLNNDIASSYSSISDLHYFMFNKMGMLVKALCLRCLDRLQKGWESTIVATTQNNLIQFLKHKGSIQLLVLGKLGSWILLCNIIFPKLDQIWKTTIFSKNGRWPENGIIKTVYPLK